MALLHFDICATLLMYKIDLIVVLNVPFLMALENEDSLEHQIFTLEFAV